MRCSVDTHTVGHGEEWGFVFGSVERSGNSSTSSLSRVLRPWLLYPCLPTANGVSFLVREYRRIKGWAVPAVHLHGEAGAHGVQGPLLSGQLAAVCPAGGTSQVGAAVTAGLSLALFFILVSFCDKASFVCLLFLHRLFHFSRIWAGRRVLWVGIPLETQQGVCIAYKQGVLV